MTFPPVPVRKLGSQGLEASVQGLGCMGMSQAYKPLPGQPQPSEEESLATINRALELGVTFLDTSNVYGPFTNEVLVGKAIRGRREKFTIATKCGIVRGQDGQTIYDGSRKHVREACEASLQRLGIDAIDLYYLHRVDPHTPVSETFAEFKALIEEGKVRHVGISEASPEDIREAHAVTPLTAVQLEWSLWTRDAERDVIPVIRELGIGIVAYSPLGRGILTGAITKYEDIPQGDRRLDMPRFQKGAIERNLELVSVVKSIAARKGVTPGQLALAWVHTQGDDVFTIPGTKRISYLEENVGALAVQVTAEDLQELDAAFAPGKVVGDRYSNMKKRT